MGRDTDTISVDAVEFIAMLVQHIPHTRRHQVRYYGACTPEVRKRLGFSRVPLRVKHGIPGDFVECGVWRGGGSMLAAKTFLKAGDTGRKLYLYDTYRGMSEPAEVDVSRRGEDAREEWEKARKGEINTWCYSSIEEVRKNMHSTGYPPEKIVFVEEKVEETIPGTIPEEISILRLDTDWCQSTYHELVHLYPRLAVNGILFVDDYGMWQGARKAVDRYLQEQGKPVYLHRIDHSARLAVKPG